MRQPAFSIFITSVLEFITCSRVFYDIELRNLRKRIGLLNPRNLRKLHASFGRGGSLVLNLSVFTRFLFRDIIAAFGV